MRVSCIICKTGCVGCSKRCRCGMSVPQVEISNSIVLENPSFKDDKSILQKVIAEAKMGKNKEVIIAMIEGGEYEEYEYPEPVIDSVYCQFPVGSQGQGKRVKCIKCSKFRFECIGKICSLGGNK